MNVNALPRVLWSIKEFCLRHNISRSSCYAEIALGNLKRTKFKRRSYISEEDAVAWLVRLKGSSK